MMVSLKNEQKDGLPGAMPAEERRAQELVSALVAAPAGDGSTWRAFLAIARAEGIRRAERQALFSFFTSADQARSWFEKGVAELNDAIAFIWGGEEPADEVRDMLQAEARTAYWRRAAQIIDSYVFVDWSKFGKPGSGPPEA